MSEIELLQELVKNTDTIENILVVSNLAIYILMGIIIIK